MLNEAELQRPAPDQIRDARDLLTRLYREIGISAVAAALEVRKDNFQSARPAIDVLKTTTALQPVVSSQLEHTRAA